MSSYCIVSKICHVFFNYIRIWTVLPKNARAGSTKWYLGGTVSTVTVLVFVPIRTYNYPTNVRKCTCNIYLHRYVSGDFLHLVFSSKILWCHAWVLPVNYFDFWRHSLP